MFPARRSPVAPVQERINHETHGIEFATATPSHFRAGRGRRTSSPPQFGQMLVIASVQAAQKVHS